jgi:hypothetical protein
VTRLELQARASRGKDSAKEVTSRSIKKVKVNFRSGKDLLKTVADAGIKKVKD